MSGAAVYGAFTRAIDAGFADFRNVHTYVLCFDDKPHVPSRKAATQGARRDAIAASIARRNVPEWRWDGSTSIVEPHSHDSLPPWERVRIDSAAYRHALDNIVSALLEHYTPPPGRRVLVDSSSGVHVIEASWQGRVLAAYTDARHKPAIGEADIAAQHYVARALVDERYDALEHAEARGVMRVPEEHAHFYTDECTDIPREWRVHSETQHELVDASKRRVNYEAGDILLQSTDSDFVPLGLVAETSVARSLPDTRVHVSLGVVHLDDAGGYCTSTTADARMHTEIYDMHRLATLVRRLHGATEPACMTSIWSFVAFCAACGNDYTKRLYGFSHTAFFAAYCQFIERRGRLVSRIHDDMLPLVDAKAFSRFLRIAYYERLPERLRPVSWTDDVPMWGEIAAVVRSTTSSERSYMPLLDDLTRYFEQISWSLVYAAVAVRGVEHVPEPMTI